MTPASWRDDDDLASELGEALAEQRDTPDRVREMGYAAFTWHSVDLDLALMSLVHDSAVHQPAGVRSGDPQAPRVLVFESDELTVEIEIGVDTIMGHLVPVGAARLDLESRTEETHGAETDDSGFFLLQRPATSPVRLRIDAEVGVLVTDWFPV